MPIPKSRENKSTKKKSVNDDGSFPIITLLIMVVLVGLILAVYFYSRSVTIETDTQTLCAIGQKPPSVNYFVIDSTDRFSDGERYQIINEITRLRDSLQRFSLLEVFVIGDDYGITADPLISICNPGKGEDMNQLYQNPQFAQQRWENDFNSLLEDALSTAVTQSESNQSPIMETIKIIGQIRFTDPSFDSVEKRMYLFSDLMQHSPGKYTQYQSTISEYPEFRTSQYFSEIQVDLRDVESFIYYVQRPRTAQYQNSSHQRFWIQYLESAGSEVHSFKRLFGD